MKAYAALAVAVTLSAIAGLAHAGTIVSPPLWTGTNTSGACYVRNVGGHDTSVQVTALLNFTPGFITPSFQNCNDAPLPAGRTCVFLVNDLPDDVTFACSAVIGGSPKNVRATVEVRALSPFLRVIAAEDLR